MLLFEEEPGIAIDFQMWFRTSIVEPFSRQIPSTIQYLCRALQVEDPWVYQ